MKLGYTIIYVDDVEAAIGFYEKAFDVERGFVHEEGDYGEMLTGDTTLAFTSHALAATVVPGTYTKLDPTKPPAGFELTLTTPAVAEGFAQAVEAGAEALAEPHEKPWGQTVSYVRDPFGVLVGIVSPMDAG